MTINGLDPQLDGLLQAAASCGLNLGHFLVPSALEAAGLKWPVAGRGTLLLLGNGGGDFWRHLSAVSGGDIDAAGRQLTDQLIQRYQDDPIDAHATDTVHDLLSKHLDKLHYSVLYPRPVGNTPQPRTGSSGEIREASQLRAVEGEHDQVDIFALAPRGESEAAVPQVVSRQAALGVYQLPLQQLGRLAGWHQNSPLGSGLHPQWGLWYAYRVLLWLDLDLPQGSVYLQQHTASSETSQKSSAWRDENAAVAAETAMPVELGEVCLNCESQACQQACPAEAIKYGSEPQMQACADHRFKSQSSCIDRCLARESCPVAGPARSYPREQIRYHYSVALQSLKTYYG